MPFYWSRNAIPELGKVPKSERRRVWWEAIRRCGWSPRILAGPAIGITVMLASAFYYKDVAAFLGVGSMGRMVVYLVGWMSGFVLMEHFLSVAALPHIRAIVGGLCVHCGYDLRGTPERCPECGASASHVV